MAVSARPKAAAKVATTPPPSLGAADLIRWRANPVAFLSEVVVNPETGLPFELLPAELEFIARAFKVDDAGRLLYPEQVYAAPKKSGKTAFAALHTLVTTLVYGGAFAEGYACANDLEQAQGRVFAAIRRIVEASPLLRADASIMATRIEFASTGATITAIANDYAGAAGGNPTISTFDELWAFTSERGRRLWDEMVPPPTRKIASRLTCTYAGFEGESQLLEELYKRGLAQPEIARDLHAGDGLLMFWTHEPVAPWQTPAWLVQMRGQLRPNAYLRMIENRWVSTESSFVDMLWWDACIDPDLTPVVLDRRLPVWIGIDASVKRDSTAVVAVTWDDNAKKVRLVYHRIFQPTQTNHLDFEATIATTVRALCSRFSVRKARFDPYQMQAIAQSLTRENIPMEEFAQSVPNLTEASTNLYELVKARGITVYPDDAIRKAIGQSIAVETTRGWRIAKEKVSHKIDVVVALAMAAHAAVLDSGELDAAELWRRAFPDPAASLRLLPSPSPSPAAPSPSEAAPDADLPGALNVFFPAAAAPPAAPSAPPDDIRARFDFALGREARWNVTRKRWQHDVVKEAEEADMLALEKETN